MRQRAIMKVKIKIFQVNASLTTPQNLPYILAHFPDCMVARRRFSNMHSF